VLRAAITAGLSLLEQGDARVALTLADGRVALTVFDPAPWDPCVQALNNEGPHP
jgi:hypothetical protein